MSKGPGHIERVVAEAFSANPDKTFTVAQLAALAYPGANRIEKKHRVAVSRAANKVAQRMWWTWGMIGVPSAPVVYYNLCNVRSYAIGRALAWFTNKGAEEWIDDPERNRDWHLMQPGNTWHDHVQLHIAQRDGIDPEPDIRGRQDDRDDQRKAMFGR